jgi:hypothetical protein
MKKFFPVLLGLMLPLASAMADSFVDEAVSFCRSKGGDYTMADMVPEGDKYCRQVTCRRTTSDRYEIPGGAPGPEANVEATKKVCVPKSQIDGNFEPGRNQSGSQSGAQSGSQSGAQSGSQSGAQSGSQSGAQSGSQSGAQSGSQSGAQSGSQSGAQSGSQSGAQSGGNGGADGYRIICDELEVPLDIYPGDRCWNACKPRRGFLGILGPKKEGGERESCLKCLRINNPNARWKDARGGVRVQGVTVGTGRLICRREGINGSTFEHNGTTCPSGSVIVNGQVVSTGNGGNGNGGNGTIVIQGGIAAGGNGGNGGVVISGGGSGSAGLPAICQSTRRADQEACDLWIRNNARFNCSVNGNCGGVEGSVRSRYDQDCYGGNCAPGSRQQSTLSGIAEIAGAIAPPLAALGIGYFQSRAYERGQQAWAGAAAVGFEQCQISQNNYLQYTAANELPGITPEQQRQMGCNGFGLGQFAGMGGQFGGLYGAGYSPGFIGGMMGPYGGYNPYGGGGGWSGGFAGGFAGGMQGGFQGGMYQGGMYPAGGGFAQGISLAGGIAGGMYNGGMQGGFQGGMYQGGFQGGMYQGGFQGGMYQGGFQGGIYQGGFQGGIYQGGFQGGIYQGGFQGGMMYPAGGMAGGMYNGGFQGGGFQGGGFAQGVSIAGGFQGGGFQGGGFQGGYNPYGGGGIGGWGSGIGTGYGYPGAGGGYFGGAGGFGNSGALSGQTANYDAMLQQRGLAYNMGQMSQGGMGGYGAAGYGPMNLGAQLGGGFQFGGQFGGGFY